MRQQDRTARALVFSSYLIDIAPILPNKGSAHKTGDGSPVVICLFLYQFLYHSSFAV